MVSQRSAGHTITLATNDVALPPPLARCSSTWNRSANTLAAAAVTATTNNTNLKKRNRCALRSGQSLRTLRRPRYHRYRQTCPGGKSPPVVGLRAVPISRPCPITGKRYRIKKSFFSNLSVEMSKTCRVVIVIIGFQFLSFFFLFVFYISLEIRLRRHKLYFIFIITREKREMSIFIREKITFLRAKRNTSMVGVVTS